MSSIIHNRVPDPRCTTRRNTANGVAVNLRDETSSTPGKWHYERPAGTTSGANWIAVYNQAHQLSVGDIMYAHLKSAYPDQFLHYQQTSADRMRLIWSREDDGGYVQCAWEITQGNITHNITTMSGAIILLHAGAYTADGWHRLLDLYQSGRIGLPWCAGPVNPDQWDDGKGLWEP